MNISMFLTALFIGFVVMFLPLLLAFISWAVSGFKGKMWSEGGGGHGIYIWLMMITLPVGFSVIGVAVLARLITWLISLFA